MEATTIRANLIKKISVIFIVYALGAGAVVAQSSATYTYDALGRVVTVTDSSGTTTYNYDAAGNRTLVKTTLPNRPPVASADSWSTAYGTAIGADPRVNDSDPDGDSLTVTGVGPAANGTTSFTGTSVTYAPRLGFNGNDSFSYTISDGRDMTAGSTVSIAVAASVNQPPVAADDSFAISAALPELAEGCIAVLANDSDPNGDALTIESFTQASSGTVYQWDTALCYRTPPVNAIRTFTYTISDGHGGTATATVTVQVKRDTF